MDTPATTTAPHPDTFRRRLLLGLPGGLVLASPLALIACGGGDGSGTGPTDPTDPGTPDDKTLTLPAFDVETVRVAVALPAGSGIAPETTRLGTMQAFATVARDGTSAMLALDGAPQLAYLFGADGELLLLGYVGDGAARVDARSTAEALIYLAARMETQPTALQIALREALRTAPVVDPVETVVAASVGKAGIGTGNKALVAALKTAVGTIVAQPKAPASARKRPQGLQMTAPGPTSGVEMVEGVAFNTLVVRNHYRRRAWAWVERVGYVDADGAEQTLPAPVPLGGDADPGLDVSATTALSFDNLVISAGDFLLGLADRIGLVGDYAYAQLPWSPADAGPVALPLEPPTARRTDYRVRVIGPGATEGAGLKGAEGAKLDELVAATVVEDVVMPVLNTLVLPAIGKKAGDVFQNKIKETLAATIALDLFKVEAQRQYLPATVAAIRAGDFNTALYEFMREFFGSGVWSTILETGLRSAVKTFSSTVTELRDANGVLSGVNLVTEAEQRAGAVRTLTGALGKIVAIKEIVEKGAMLLDLAAVAHDLAGSTVKKTFAVSVTGLKAMLTPETARMIAPGSGIQNFTVTLASDNGYDSTDPTQYTYEWSCTEGFGEINDGANNIGTAFTSTRNVVGFAPNGKAESGDVVTVTCKVRRVNAVTGGAGQSLVATRTATLKFTKEFNVTLSPGEALEIPTETTFPLLAKIGEKLPAGAVLRWKWSASGAGRVVQDNRYAAAYAGQTDSSMRNLVTGKTEGRATVSVYAEIDLPATGTEAARTVVTDPASTPFTVKSNVETITFKPPGGAFACSDPLACGVGSYGAYIVPILPRAISYTAVFSGFGYAGCNRSVTWNAPVGDGGDCNFPISYHPHSSKGPTNLWAVWLGFGDTWNPDGECEVTIVLRKP